MKNKLFSFLLGLSVLFVAYQAWAATVDISTYYPSPFGSYTQLDTVTLNVTGNATVTGNTTVTGNLAVTGTSTVGGDSGVTGNLWVNGNVTTPGTVSATAAVQTQGSVLVGTFGAPTINLNGAAGTVTVGGMTIRGASTNAGDLQVVSSSGRYYCHAVYA